MKEVTISLDLANAIISYIGTKPYQEVHQLVTAIQHQVSPQLQEPQGVADADNV